MLLCADLYSEWEDMKAYGEHYNSPYTKKYLEAISKIGVVSLFKS